MLFEIGFERFVEVLISVIWNPATLDGNSNPSNMNTLYTIKDIYTEAFKNLEHFITKNYFRLFAWFSFSMFAVVVYAFVFRVATGFAFV